MDAKRCALDCDNTCSGELWQCQTCDEWYCQYHFHVTAKGKNVECAACEYNAADYARDYPSGESNVRK